jgi:hypothetical protein
MRSAMHDIAGGGTSTVNATMGHRDRLRHTNHRSGCGDHGNTGSANNKHTFRRNNNHYIACVRRSSKLSSLILLGLILLVVYSLVDHSRNILKLTGTVLRKEHQEPQLEMELEHNYIIPTWEETEAWTRHSEEWNAHLFPSSSSSSTTVDDETQSQLQLLSVVPYDASFPRILFMDGRKRNVTVTLTTSRKQQDQDPDRFSTMAALLQWDDFDTMNEHSNEAHYDHHHDHHVYDEAHDALRPTPPECVPMAAWQTRQFPTCNVVHELDVLQGVRTDARMQRKRTKTAELRMKILGKGGMRLAWSAASQHHVWSEDDDVADDDEEEGEFEEDDGHPNNKNNTNTIHSASITKQQQLRTNVNVNGTHHDAGTRRTTGNRAITKTTTNNTSDSIILKLSSQRHENQQEHQVNDNDNHKQSPSPSPSRSRQIQQQQIQQRQEQIILKTLKWPREYTARIYEHNRVDALVSERLTASPHVIDIYGYCGNAVLNEMASSNSMDNVAKHADLSPVKKLEYVTQAAQGIADVQSIDYFHHHHPSSISSSGSGRGSITSSSYYPSMTDTYHDPCNSTVVHNDMGPSNFLVAKNGRVKLSDFNLSVLQYWNTTTKGDTSSNQHQHEQCGFRHAHKCGVHGAMVSPESCLESTSLTEKIDVYGLGSIIFFILTQGHVPYAFNEFSDNDSDNDNDDNDSDKEPLTDDTMDHIRIDEDDDDDANRRREEAIATAIMQGVPPLLPSELEALMISSSQEQEQEDSNDNDNADNNDSNDDSNDNRKAIRTMIRVMRQAMQYHPQDRPTARTLADQLQRTLQELTTH